MLAGSGVGECVNATPAEIQRVGSRQVIGKPPRPRLHSTRSVSTFDTNSVFAAGCTRLLVAHTAEDMMPI